MRCLHHLHWDLDLLRLIFVPLWVKVTKSSENLVQKKKKIQTWNICVWEGSSLSRMIRQGFRKMLTTSMTRHCHMYWKGLTNNKSGLYIQCGQTEGESPTAVDRHHVLVTPLRAWVGTGICVPTSSTLHESGRSGYCLERSSRCAAS